MYDLSMKQFLIITLLGLTMSSPITQAESVRGKVITILSPNSAGGMMTRYARMIAPYIAKHSGAQDVRVRVMTGGGGIRGTNFLWFSEPDGRTIAFTSVTSLILAQLSGSEAVQFDTTQLVYLGRAATEPRVFTVGATSGIMNIEDARTLNRQFIFPSQGTDEDFYSMAVLADVLDIDMKVVSGYDGNADTALAVIKGDGDGHITGWLASQAIIESGDEHPILTLSQDRYAPYPHVPTALELVKGQSREAVQAIVNMLDMRRGFFAPPGLDSTATQELRSAISAAFTDPDLIAESKLSGLPLLPSDGHTEQAKIGQITTASQTIIPILQAALEAIR
jgi:tripartite-type tricarboxylate transporter receptor subunit TctC